MLHLALVRTGGTLPRMSSDAMAPTGGPEDHGFGRRPNHQTPGWVATDATFHIRVRTSPDSPPLTEPPVAKALLESARLYAERRR